MLKKVGFVESSKVQTINTEEFKSTYASSIILERLEKFANTIRAVAPRSEDFLYFTIIFLKAAESALIDEHGNLKKIGSDNAWGYFDDKWKWHGNVKAHKNSNGDLFPEAELKKAARNWIGKPLCVDHSSDSVDGIRGIILDTYYDEKLKQVVGLCALDKVNYPDLARKVQTGIVRYGSMGTAVTTSICTECSKAVTSPQDYCQCILTKQAWGEINVGLNPIEYSLVVQPAEPGAILLRCFASIKTHEKELNSYGLTVDTLLESLDDKKANGLDLLLNNICKDDICSLEQRQRIIKGYLQTNGFSKSASVKKSYNKELLTDLAKFEDVFGVKYSEDPDLYKEFFGDVLDIASGVEPADVEKLTSEQNAVGSDTITMKDSNDTSDLTGAGSSSLTSGVSEPLNNSFKTDGVGPEHYAFSDVKNKQMKLSSIVEEIMNESRLRQRAALRRKLAYPQGGSDSAAEPSTYKHEGSAQEKIREQDDKQMHPNPTNLGGTDGMVPGDKEIKEKQLRASKNGTKKQAYHQGATAPAVEPSTFKTEDYHKYWESDKHMHQTKSMGGENGMFPGDEKIKEQQKRAKYEGPALSTKFKQLRGLDGSINKAASCFEVYSGDKLVIAATAGNIFGKKLDENWKWITSKEYAKTVVAEIREKGLDYVGGLLTKKAQDLSAAPEMPAELGDATLPAETGAPGELPESLPEEGGMESEESPKAAVENALVEMEDTIDQIRTALGDMSGEDVVNINIGDEAEMPEEKVALSKNILNQLKVVFAEAKDSADELAMLAETADRYNRLTRSQKRDLRALASGALQDFYSISGQSQALISMAETITKSLVKTSEYMEQVSEAKDVEKKEEEVKKEEKKETNMAEDKKEESEQKELVAKAMELRKMKRMNILKKAQEKMKESEEAYADDSEEEKKENEAHDGIGLPENAPVAGVTKDLAADIATKKPVGGDHKPAPSKGNQDAKQFNEYPSTNSRQLAEQSMTSVKQNKAEDEMSDMAKDQDEPKESEAKDSEVKEESEVKSKLSTAFMKKKDEEEREAYKLKLRRAYGIGMEMQRKGMIPATRPALDRQVDNMMEFDDRAFEAFKKSVAGFQGQVKVASDLGGLNIGITEEVETTRADSKTLAKSLADLWK